MPRFRALALASATLLILSGCSVFYPNWGATELPEEPTMSAVPTETETVTAEPEPTDTEMEASAEPEPTETEEPEIEKVQTEVTIIMAVAGPDFGVLTVVAQIPDGPESAS